VTVDRLAATIRAEPTVLLPLRTMTGLAICPGPSGAAVWLAGADAGVAYQHVEAVCVLLDVGGHLAYLAQVGQDGAGSGPAPGGRNGRWCYSAAARMAGCVRRRGGGPARWLRR